MKINLPKITPGDWRIGDAGKTIFGPPTDNPSPRTVARMPQISAPCKVSDIDESIANAKAIAAVPALLHSLSELIRLLSLVWENDCDIFGAEHHNAVDAEEKARAALIAAGCEIEQ